MHIRRTLIEPLLSSLVAQFQGIRAAAGVEPTYAPPVLEDATAVNTDAEQAHVWGERVDATDLPLVTIDPEGAQDLDQALHVERRGDGHRVFYAIADVGAHVRPGGALDLDTQMRVETAYCPDTRIGLHPPVMSEGFASLLPNQRTKAVLWTLDLDVSGDLVGIDVHRAWVRSRAQYSYIGLTRHPPIEARQLISLMAELGGRRRALARARGAVTLPKPTQEFTVVGDRVTLEFRAGVGIEDDNAQISLMTGEAAARLMVQAGVGIVRTMPAAEDEAIARLRHQARALGIAWDDSESYGDVLAGLDPTSPKVAAFLTAATALFRGATWKAFDDSDPALPRPDDMRHGALGVPYAHVTAPLRRLVDRFGTEICLAVAAQTDVPAWARGSLTWIEEAMAAGVKVSRQVERECIVVVEAAVLAPYVGETFTGIALDRSTIQISEPAIIARCSGDLEVGREVRVTLTRATLKDGILFSPTPMIAPVSDPAIA